MLSNGDKIGPYTVRETAGKGGMATVYQAWHEGLHRFEALKVPRGAQGGAPDSAYVQRLLAEARVAAGLHHPNIVAIHSVSEPLAPIPFFAMDWVDGRDLAKVLAEHGPFSLRDTVQILQPVAQALDYAHEKGVVHRDIKPANILLSEKNGVYIPKVVDFGISRAAEDEDGETKLTKSGMIVGTPEYMSPEQAGSGEIVDRRTDLYSLAVVVYEMLCGGPPFTAGDGVSRLSILVKHVRDVAPLFQKCPNFPRPAGEALLRALSKVPSDRQSSCAAFLQQLDVASQSEPFFILDDCSSDERTPFDSSRFEPVDAATIIERPPVALRGEPGTMTPQPSGPATAVAGPGKAAMTLRERLEAVNPGRGPVDEIVTAPQKLPLPVVSAKPGEDPTPGETPARQPETNLFAPPKKPAPQPVASSVAPAISPPVGGHSLGGHNLGGHSSRTALLAGFGGVLVGAALVFSLFSRVSQPPKAISPVAPAGQTKAVPKQQTIAAPVVTPSFGKPSVAFTSRLRTVRVTRTREVPFATITRRDFSLPLGKKRITQKGRNGQNAVVLEISYKGDKEVTRRTVSNQVTRQPSPQIVSVGTKPVATPSPSVEPSPTSRPAASPHIASPRIEAPRKARPLRVRPPRPRPVEHIAAPRRPAVPHPAKRHHVREAPLPP